MSKYDDERAAQRREKRRAHSDLLELRGLKGGEKSLWLNIHRDEVLAYLEAHGDVEARRHYGLTTPRVLEELKTRWYAESRNRKLTEAQRLRAEIGLLEEDIADNRREIRQLKDEYFRFQESVSEQLTSRFFAPLLRLAIRLPPGLEPAEKPDPLNVAFLMEHIDTDEMNEQLKTDLKEGPSRRG